MAIYHKNSASIIKGLVLSLKVEVVFPSYFYYHILIVTLAPLAFTTRFKTREYDKWLFTGIFVTQKCLFFKVLQFLWNLNFYNFIDTNPVEEDLQSALTCLFVRQYKSWLNPNHTDPIYVIKHALRGSKKELRGLSPINKNLSSEKFLPKIWKFWTHQFREKN